jgi:molybdenum cofactor synthesis domain-containing protein
MALPSTPPRGDVRGDRRFVAERLLAPSQAICAYFARVELAAPRRERVALGEAASRILARDALARDDHPSHARSTMDGFAVRSSGDQRRKIVGEILMGRAPPRSIEADETLRIPTGGALPEGADAVIPIEDVDVVDETIVMRAAVAAGENLTERAADLRAGECVLKAGRRLGAPELGVLATLGCAQVEVFVRPRFGIISTGDELIDVEQTPGLGQIRDSNRYAIGAALAALGADPVQLPRAADDASALRDALRAALASCDGVILTGGSSVGERDLTPAVVAEIGAPGPVVHGLRVKPGKPAMLGAIGPKPVIGLPGNPASALMILEAVARPIVVGCTGATHDMPIVVDAIAAKPFRGREGWTWFVPTRMSNAGGTLVAEPLPLRSSHVSLLARAGGYVTLGETATPIEAGERVGVALFSSGGAPAERSG